MVTTTNSWRDNRKETGDKGRSQELQFSSGRGRDQRDLYKASSCLLSPSPVSFLLITAPAFLQMPRGYLLRPSETN